MDANKPASSVSQLSAQITLEGREIVDTVPTRLSSFRIELGDGTEPPRLVIDPSHYMIEDEKVADLQNRVGRLEAQIRSLGVVIERLQAQLETRLK